MIIGWIILSVVVGIAGSAREIGGLRSFAVSVLFSPLIGFIVVLFSKRKDLIEFENTTLRKQQEQLDLLKNKSIADELLKLTHGGQSITPLGPGSGHKLSCRQPGQME